MPRMPRLQPRARCRLQGAGCADKPGPAECPEDVVRLVPDTADELFLSPGAPRPEAASAGLRELLSQVVGTPSRYQLETSYRIGDRCVFRYQVEGLLLKEEKRWSGFVIFTVDTRPPPEILTIDFAS